MKIIRRPLVLAGIAGAALLLVLSSFSLIRGGDSYTISVNGKQLIQHYVHSKDVLPSLTLNPGSQEVVTVYYSECGKIGTARKLTIRDQQNTILKEWKFADTNGEHTPMTINSKDIVTKENVSLYYGSELTTTPRKLVNLVMISKSTASR